MQSFYKQPGDLLDYDIVLTDWLEDGDEVESVDVTVPEGIELDNRGIFPDRVKLWLKGGETGQIYKITARIFTESRVKEIDFKIIVVDT